jgi:sensor histidine kinase YesM
MKGNTLERLTDQKRLVTHGAIIAVALLFALPFTFLRNPHADLRAISKICLLMILQIESFLLMARIAFPRDLPAVATDRIMTRKQANSFILVRFGIFFFLCILSAFIIFIPFSYFFFNPGKENFGVIWHNFFTLEFRGWFFTTLKGLGFGAVIFVTILWQDALKKSLQLREQNLIFQNETLKNQVNPHFLFNNLNTLSSLIHSDPELADRFVTKLSGIYRYITENFSRDSIPLNQELGFITEYFSLYQIRDENKMSLEISVLQSENYRILPVSLQILVENAIKHNMATRENPLKIKVEVSGDFISVSNNLQKMATMGKTTGTGLKNLGQRVTLITGRDLEISETGSLFTVKLPLII